MAWSYDPGLLTDKDKVRFYVGDVDTTDQLRSDEEIEAIVAIEGTILEASAATCESLAAQYAREVTKTTGRFRREASDKSKRYSELAGYLRGRSGAEDSLTAVPHVGGISVSRKETVESDTDRVDPAFSVGMRDNPRARYGTDTNEEEEP